MTTEPSPPTDRSTATPPRDPAPAWSRHPGDVLRAVVALLATLLALGVFVWARNATVGLEQDLTGLVDGLPRDLVLVVFGLYQLAALVVPVLVLAWIVWRRHWQLLGMYVATTAVAVGIFLLVGPWIDERLPTRPTPELDVSQAQLVSAVDLTWIASFAAALTVTAPWMSRRWHRAAWWILLLLVPLRLVVGVDVPSGLLLAISLGWFVGALALLVFGAPDREPSPDAVVRAMGAAGLEISELRRASVDARGSTPYFATGADGRRHFVKVLGNDERSADLLFRAFRYLRLRNVGDERPFSSLRRAVEHEGMVSVWAERAGVRTPRTEAVVALPDGGMALVYGFEAGTSIDAVDASELTDEFVRDLWRQVALLQADRIAHRDLRRANVFRTESGQPMVIDFGFGEVSVTDDLLAQDVAQLILSLAIDIGAERSVAAAVDVLGADAVAAAAPRLQLPALSGATQSALKEHKGLLEQTRAEVRQQTGAEDVELVELQRVKGRTLLTMVVIAALTFFVINQISELPTLIGQIREADWTFGGLALLFSFLTYVGAAIALTASVPSRLSVARTTLVTLGGSFVNRISPVKVGGIALNFRYLQKSGLDSAVAASSLSLMALVGFLTHMSLLVVFSVWAGRTVDFSRFLPRGTWLYVAVGLVLGLIGVVVAVPRIRHLVATKVGPQLHSVGASLRDLAQRPSRLLLLVVGSAILTLSYIAALEVSIRAFGGQAPVAGVAVVFLAGASIAAAAPTPGGVGAVEAALVGGLSALGVPVAIAVPAVFLYRLATFWLPILPGWLCFNTLQRRELI